jgi:hypothetical protein
MWTSFVCASSIRRCSSIGWTVASSAWTCLPVRRARRNIASRTAISPGTTPATHPSPSVTAPNTRSPIADASRRLYIPGW